MPFNNVTEIEDYKRPANAYVLCCINYSFHFVLLDDASLKSEVYILHRGIILPLDYILNTSLMNLLNICYTF